MWLKLDDKFWRNEKMRRLSHAARGVFADSLSFCGDTKDLTGFLTTQQALDRAAGPGARRLVAELVSNENLEVVNGGYLIHDFENYVPTTSKDRTREWRERKRLEGVTGASPKRHRRVTVTHAPSRARDGKPEPEPEPVFIPLPPVAPPPPEVLELQISLSRVLGIVQPRGGDVLIVQRFWDDFHARYEGVVDMVTTVELDVARREREGREPIHSLEGCRIPLRWEHDMRADRGSPRRSSAGVAGLDMEPLAAILPLAARSE